MKRFRKIYSAAILGLMALSSCTDGQDWSVDSTFDRLFGTQSITVTTYDTKVAVAFDLMPDATGYQVEVSTDSLYGDDINTNSILDTLTTTPDTIYNLAGDTKYYMRMRSIADGKTSSKWVYYESGSGNAYFKTKAEQIFEDVTSDDYDDSYITVRWDSTKTVTSLTISQDGEVVDSVILTDEQKTAGTYTFTNLTASTTYEINIYNGSAKRGTLTVTTAAAMPSANYKYTLPTGTTVISQELIDQLAATAKEKAGSETSYSVTIAIPAGSEVSVNGTSDDGSVSALTIPDGMAVNFFGLSGGDTPTLTFPKTMDLAGTHAYITFQNLKLVDDGSNYFVNQSNATTIDQFSITDCEGSGFGNAFFRLQGSNTKVITNLTITDCIFHDMCSGYSFIHVDAGSGKGVVKNISISDATFYNVATGGKMFIYSRNTDMESIVIDHITVYNSIGNNNYFIDFDKKTGAKADKLTISNSIFSKQPDEGTKTIRTAGTYTIDNCYITNDFFKVFDGVTSLDASATDVFNDPENADFTLNASYLKLNAGDSRWITEE
ncbi:MAG: DUF5123 domain-containing protein [Prevotella sp.]